MARFKLSQRSLGSEFCALERALIFDRSYLHTGWVHFISPDSVVLEKSRFTDVHSEPPVVYICPPDLSIKVQEGDLITVVPGSRFERILSGDDRQGEWFKRGPVRIEVESLEEARIPAVAPALPKDEFLERVSSDWAGADLDMLDSVMALLLVSAPPSVYGRGGVGSEGLSTPREKSLGSPIDVARSVESKLPAEFLGPGGQYMFETLDKLGNLRSFKKARTSEACFSLVRPHRVSEAWAKEGLPIQLPFVLDEARMRRNVERSDYFDLDLLDYQLCALYTPPPDQDLVMDLVRRTVKSDTIRNLFDMPGALEVDTLAGVRVALALMRLNVGKEFRGRNYIRRPLSGHEEGLRIFTALMKRGMEEVERRSRQEDLFRKDRSLPFRERLTDNDRQLYYALRRIIEEEGLQEVPLERLAPKKGRRAFDDSVVNLNRYGYLLLMRGGTTLKPVDLDSL